MKFVSTALTARARAHAAVPSLALAIILLAAILPGCGAHKPSPGGRNLRPNVRLTAGPVRGDSVRYNSTFYWSGWDDDGVIDHYQYAIDIPGHFTQDDIDNPNAVGIAWHDTLATQAAFVFVAAQVETLQSSEGNEYVTSRPYGPHTLYLRSVDNEGGVSKAADVSFTAYTILPRATIVGPPRLVGITAAGRRLVDFSVRWKGYDPDRFELPRDPAFYEWKMIRLGAITEPVVPDDIIHGPIGTSFPWHRVTGDVRYLATRLDAGVPYLFALRALDEAGGLEDTFVLGRNALVLQATGAAGLFVSPVLTVLSLSLGTFTFPADGDSIAVEILEGRCLRFTMSGDARAYGGTMGGYNWCLDRTDDTSGCDWGYSGFDGWGGLPLTTPEDLCFQQPGTHHLLIEARDTQGNTTSGRFEIRVLPFPHDREVLYVDDFRGPLPGAAPDFDDAAMDARFVAALHTAGYSQVDAHDVWGAGDVTGVPHPPSLEKLSHYRLVFWSTNGEGGGLAPGVSGLLQAAGCGSAQVLRAYVAAGGALCLSGVGVVGAVTPRADAGGVCRAADNATGPDIHPGGYSFLCNFLSLCGGGFRRAGPGDDDGLTAAQVTGAAAAAGFPTVPVDASLFAGAGRGLSGYDAALDMPGFVVGLDTLYTAEVAGVDSPFRGRPIGWRWNETDNPVRLRGPVALFAFPLEALATRPPGAGDGHDLETVLTTLAAWFRARAVIPA